MPDKVKVAVIGVGGMGQGHCKRLAELEEADFKAVCDIDEEVLKSVSETYGVPGYTDFNELFTSEDLDAVVIATPHYQHPIVGMAAFDAGLHVLTEKPMAVTIGAAEEFVKKAKESGKVFTIMFQRRASGQFLAMKKLIDDGALGEIYRATMSANGFRAQRYYDSGEWRATWVGEGGGVIINQAPHEIDFFTALAGLPSRVYAQVKTRIHDMEVEDFAHCIMEFQNGATGYLSVATDQFPGSSNFEIAGDLGKLCIEGKKVIFKKLKAPLKEFAMGSDAVWGKPEFEDIEVEIPEVKGGHGRVLENFLRTILGTEELLIDGAVGVTELELGNAIHLSAHTGEPVDLPLDRQKVEEHFAALRASSKPKKNLRVTRETDPQHVKK